MQEKGKAEVRDVAPRGQTENTTRDLRSYRVELFLLTCRSVHQMKFLLPGRAARPCPSRHSNEINVGVGWSVVPSARPARALHGGARAAPPGVGVERGRQKNQI